MSTRVVTQKLIPAAGRRSGEVITTVTQKKKNRGGKKRNQSRSRIPQFVKEADDDAEAGFNTLAYTATLLDPWGVRGIKIPDRLTKPSFTAYSIVQLKLTAVALSGGGYECAAVFAPTKCNSTGGTASVEVGVAGATAGTLTFSSTSDWPNLVPLCAAAAGGIRPVSAGIAVVPRMNSNLTDGDITVFQTESALFGSNVPFSTNVANLSVAKTCPVRTGEVCSITYYPTVLGNQDYFNPGAANSGVNQIQLGVWMTNLVAGSTFDVTIIVNWEGVTAQSGSVTAAGIVDISPSRYSMKALEIAANLTPGIMQFRNIPEDVYDTTLAYYNQGHSSSSAASLLDALASGTSKVFDIAKNIHGSASYALHAVGMGRLAMQYGLPALTQSFRSGNGPSQRILYG